MRKLHLCLMLGLTFGCGQVVGCGSPKPEPTPEEIKKIEKEIQAGESGL